MFKKYECLLKIRVPAVINRRVNQWIRKVTSFVGVNMVGSKFLKQIHISNKFTRMAYSLLSDGKFPSTTIVHYFGSTDICPSIQLYRKQVTIVDAHPDQEPVMAPRNYKQCANTIAMERQRFMLSSDDIFGLYLLHEEVPNFIQNMQLIPNFA
ncbi:Uncharacterized protein FWK35_00016290, partial [Aphis craccivora]